MQNNKSILIVGGGSIGRRHASNFLKLGQKIEIVEPDLQKANSLKKTLNVPIISKLPAIPNLRQNFSGAVIATPPAYHINMAIRCASAGLHLLIEKPLSNTCSANIKTLKEISKSKNINILVGYNWKFHPSFILMKNIISKKHIGKILTFNVIAGQYLPDWHPAENYKKGYSASRKLGGGILLDSHEIAYISWLMGGVKQVLSSVIINTKTLGIETEDLAILTLLCKNGSVGVMQVDYLQHPYKRSYTICGTAGNINWDFEQNTLTLYTKKNKKKILYENRNYNINQMYIDEDRHFLQIINGKTKPITDLIEGERILQIIEAAKKIAKQHYEK